MRWKSGEKSAQPTITQYHNIHTINTMNKILSIIVPSYNMEAYLPKCLGSLVIADKELLQKLDVIVVNDGSKDRTSEIAHEFEAKYPGIFRVIDKENGHYGSCINAGLAVAEGVYIKVLDADDWFQTENLPRYITVLDTEAGKKGLGADLIVNDFAFVDGDKTVRKSYSWITDKCRVVDFDFRNDRDLWMHAVAYKTDKLRAIDYRQLTGIVHTDIQWLQMPMRTVDRIAYYPKVLYAYLYLREGNSSAPDEFYRTYAVQERILKHMIKEYESLPSPPDAKHDTYLRNHLVFRARRAYQVHLLKRSPLLQEDSLIDLDTFLRDHARWIYEATDHEPFSGKIPWRYIHAWRKRQRYSLWQKAELRFYEKLRSVYCKLKDLI